jgi:RimK family alpha-L-glutamate ligase
MKLLLVGIKKTLYSIKRIDVEARPFFEQIDRYDWRDLSFTIKNRCFEAKIGNKPLKEYSHFIPRIAKNYFLQKYLLSLKAEELGIRILNSSMIKMLPNYNKLSQLYLLTKAKVPVVPAKQILSKGRLKSLAYPLIIKGIRGERGTKIFRAKSSAEAERLLAKLSYHQSIVQDLILTGEDVRLLVIDHKVVAAYKRKAIRGFKTVPRGRKEAYSPTKTEKAIAIKASRVLKGECVGVDLIYYQKKPCVLEVNLDAGFKVLEQVTGINIAKKIVKQLLR